MRKLLKTSKIKILYGLIVTFFFSFINTGTVISAKQILSDEIAINENNFPDEKFRNYIKESNFDINNDGRLSKDEIEKITYIYVTWDGLKTLKGIEHFKNLEYLYAELNYIESIDLSKNTKLIGVYLNNNMIKSIKLPNENENNTLRFLEIYNNELTTINLKNLKAVEMLSIASNMLTEVDLSDNISIESYGLIVDSNYLKKIILPNNGKNYEWVKYLPDQYTNVGEKVEWYLDEGRNQKLDPVTTPTIKFNGQTLYSKYAPISYTVEFNTSFFGGEKRTQEFKYGEAKKLLKNEFKKPGEHYKFTGWRDSQGRIYSDEQEVKNLTTRDGNVIKLTATWEEIDYTGQKYSVRLYDGEELLNQFEGTYGTLTKIPKNEREKEGFEFAGWNEGKGDHVMYSDGSLVLITHGNQLIGKVEGTEQRSLDLHAVWKKKEYTVNFIDSQKYPTQIVEHNEKVKLPTPQNKEGYTFEGWVTESGEKWNEETGITSNINLYAKYNPIKYSISFNGNGANNEGAMSNKNLQMNYSEQAILPKNEYEKEMHIFEGWSTTPNGNVEFTDNQVVYNLVTENNKNLTLYAVWKIDKPDSTISITTDSLDKVYDGEIISNPSVDKTGSTNEVTFTWYKMVGSEWKQLESAPTNTGKYKVVASVAEDSNYDGASTEKEFVISQSENSWTETLDIEGWTYGEKVKNPTAAAKFGDVVFTYSNSKNGVYGELPKNPNAGIWYVKATVEGNENYTGLESIKEFVIKKAIPTYIIPAELNAVYGQKLSDIKLPKGFTWEEDSSKYVGNVGTYTFKLTYTPEDTVNYEVVTDLEVKVNIEKAVNSWTREPSIHGWVQGIKPSTPVAESAFGKVKFTYSNEENGKFTEVVPRKAGIWYMKATVEENENFTGLEKVVSFIIEEPQAIANDIKISNGNSETTKFTYGDKIVIKLVLEFGDESITRSVDQIGSKTREVALFANGVQVTETQSVANGQEVTFVYDTSNGLINPEGNVELTVAEIRKDNTKIDISNLTITLDKKDIESGDIKLPEINDNTNLDDLEIKDGDITLKPGVDYDISKTQNGDTVTVEIIFKGNYSGTIKKNYKVETLNQSSEEDNLESDSILDSEEEQESDNSVDSEEKQESEAYNTNDNLDEEKQSRDVSVEDKDSMSIGLWIAIFALTAGVVALAVGLSIKKNRKNNK